MVICANNHSYDRSDKEQQILKFVEAHVSCAMVYTYVASKRRYFRFNPLADLSVATADWVDLTGMAGRTAPPPLSIYYMRSYGYGVGNYYTVVVDSIPPLDKSEGFVCDLPFRGRLFASMDNDALKTILYHSDLPKYTYGYTVDDDLVDEIPKNGKKYVAVATQGSEVDSFEIYTELPEELASLWDESKEKDDRGEI